MSRPSSLRTAREQHGPQRRAFTLIEPRASVVMEATRRQHVHRTCERRARAAFTLIEPRASVVTEATRRQHVRRTCERRARAAFTLIELLVVVSIISVLAAMLLPALNKARAIAKGNLCMSNMKQQQMGNMMYCDDNDGMYAPVSKKWSSITWKGMTKTNAYVPWNSSIYVGGYFGNANILSSGFPESYREPTTDVAFCPVGRADYSGGITNATWIGANASSWPANDFNSYGYSGHAPVSSFNARNADRVFTLLDVIRGSSWDKFLASGGSNYEAYRHANRANVAFMDGHVASFTNMPQAKSQGELTQQMKF